MNIYFAGSIVADPVYKDQQQEIVALCEQLGHTVISKRHAFTIGSEVSRGTDPKDVFERDMWWLLRKCDVVVAEISMMGFGLGFEIGCASMMGLQILALKHEKAEKISAFALGNTFREYTCITYTAASLKDILKKWLMGAAESIPKRKGVYIAFEGLNRCGKGTQIQLLQDRMEKEGWAFEHVFEPGGTWLGVQLRHLLQEQLQEVPAFRAEVGMLMAQRANLIEKKVVPALEKGVHVISDRSDGTSLAFQGMGRGQGVLRVAALSGYAVAGVHPDVVIYLRLSPEELTVRKKDTKGKDRFEYEQKEFERLCFEGYEKVMALESLAALSNWHALDATLSPQEIHRQIWKIVKPLVATM